MRLHTLAILASLITLAAPAFAEKPTSTAPTLSMEQIMADPDWIGPGVENAYWSSDGEVIYYSLKREGSGIRDLYKVNPQTGERSKVADAELARVDGEPLFDRAHQHAAFIRHGDVFIRDLSSGRLTQVTRTPMRETGLQWMAQSKGVQYRADDAWYSYLIDQGTTSRAATIKTEDDPQKDDADALERKQIRLFDTLREIEADADAEHARDVALAKADPTRAGLPFWLGEDVDVVTTSLSPNGRWMLVVTKPADYKEGDKPEVNHYVTRTGYSEAKETRNYVGRNAPAPQSLVLLDLREHQQFELSLQPLPGINDDPLAELRAKAQTRLREAGHEDEAKELKAPDTRKLRIADDGHPSIVWSDDGSQAAIQLRAVDNKDRWIASVDFDEHKLVPQHRLHDPAWINWLFNEFGFLPQSHTLWYLSEESGYSHLYLKPLDDAARQLTEGSFEISNPQPSEDGEWFYVRANKQAPYIYDLYRVATDDGAMQRVTSLGGLEDFVLSPNGKQVAIVHSGSYTRPQLAVVDVDGSNVRKLTDTRSAAYKAIEWIQPEVVKVPSTHGARSIYAKLYKAADFDPSKPHPAVLFVHGAGYLQDVDTGWSHYFREQMFNNLLAREGYVVLDMDYRASEGYGRDWRTAIYRNMGHPELEDLLDGKAWLVENYNVDPDRVGIYGGSYGGFMTFMALLRAPGEFAAGAAVRPVADWSSYNHGYTSNILNTPQLDPEAYRRSSPIEFAENLEDPLLIAHGLVDSNVLPDGSIRLYQRFIELHKDDFWMSLYPMEAHGFVHADSWYDEYRRIHELFTRFVLPTDQPAD